MKNFLCLLISFFPVEIVTMKWHMLQFFRIAAWLLFCTMSAAVFSPQAHAAKGSVRLTVAFSAGSALDSAARVLASEAEKILGIDIVVQNMPGGAGMAAVADIAAAKADGTRLAACAGNALLSLPRKSDAPYNPLTDVEPIIVFGQASPVLVTRPDAPWKDWEAFLEANKMRRGGMRIGVPGLGSPSHAALAKMAGKDPNLVWRFIPFGGPGEAETALLGGHVDAAASGSLPRIKQGQLSPLIILAGTRLEELPQTPCLADGGFADPGRGDASFFLLAPKNVPEETLKSLEEVFAKAVSSQAFRKTMEHFSVAPILMKRREAKAFLASEWNEDDADLNAAGIAR